MNKVKIVDQLLTSFLDVNNDHYNNGLLWYNDVNNFVNQLSHTYNVPVETAAKVVSILSPQTNWAQNKKDAINMLNAFVHGKDINSFKVTTYNMNKNKAFDLLHGSCDLLNTSPKTFAFYKNILLDCNYVTLDLWMLRLIKHHKPYLTFKQYNILQRCFIVAAKETNLTGYQLQAILWIYIRGTHL